MTLEKFGNYLVKNIDNLISDFNKYRMQINKKPVDKVKKLNKKWEWLIWLLSILYEKNNEKLIDIK